VRGSCDGARASGATAGVCVWTRGAALSGISGGGAGEFTSGTTPTLDEGRGGTAGTAGGCTGGIAGTLTSTGTSIAGMVTGAAGGAGTVRTGGAGAVDGAGTVGTGGASTEVADAALASFAAKPTAPTRSAAPITTRCSLPRTDVPTRQRCCSSNKSSALTSPHSLLPLFSKLLPVF